jgi:2-hydroxy-6-oxonona-2,4-dienedioate hydrolase
MNIYKQPLYTQAYIDTGEGQPVILLHGLFGNLAMWRRTIQTLQHDYRVIVPRLPLFEVPIHRANITSLVEVLNEFLDWHQLTDVILVGTDLGGQIALCYANAHAHRVKKVVLSGSSGLFENLPSFNHNQNVDYEFVNDHVQEVFFRKDYATPGLVENVYRTVNTFSKGLHIAFLSRSSQSTDISQFLHKLSLPVLLVWGLQDKITPPTVALHFHDLLRYGTVRFIDKCGHLPMIEQPEEYIRSVTAFLNQ